MRQGNSLAEIFIDCQRILQADRDVMDWRGGGVLVSFSKDNPRAVSLPARLNVWMLPGDLPQRHPQVCNLARGFSRIFISEISHHTGAFSQARYRS